MPGRDGGHTARQRSTLERHGWVLEALALSPGATLFHGNNRDGSWLTREHPAHWGRKVTQGARMCLVRDGFIERHPETGFSGLGVYRLSAAGVSALRDADPGSFGSIDHAALAAAVEERHPYDHRRVGWVAARRSGGGLLRHRPDTPLAGQPVTWPPCRLGTAIEALAASATAGEGVHEVETASEDATKHGVPLFRATVATDEFGDRVTTWEWLPALHEFGMWPFGGSDPVGGWVREPGTTIVRHALDEEARRAATAYLHTPLRGEWSRLLAAVHASAARLGGATSAPAAVEAWRDFRRAAAEGRDLGVAMVGKASADIADAASADDLNGVTRHARKLAAFIARMGAVAREDIRHDAFGFLSGEPPAPGSAP